MSQIVLEKILWSALESFERCLATSFCYKGFADCLVYPLSLWRYG